MNTSVYVDERWVGKEIIIETTVPCDVFIREDGDGMVVHNISGEVTLVGLLPQAVLIETGEGEELMIPWHKVEVIRLV